MHGGEIRFQRRLEEASAGMGKSARQGSVILVHLPIEALEPTVASRPPVSK